MDGHEAPEALCFGRTDEWFEECYRCKWDAKPAQRGGHSRECQAPAAEEICQSCPLQGSCLEQALTTVERHGTWGASSPIERRMLLESQGAVFERFGGRRRTAAA